jgi:GAF domain-containing protein/CheY-like chemotaxis protein
VLAAVAAGAAAGAVAPRGPAAAWTLGITVVGLALLAAGAAFVAARPRGGGHEIGSAPAPAAGHAEPARAADAGGARSGGARRDFAALLEINTKIGALAPTGALLTSIAEEAARLLDVDNAGFRLLEGDELVLAGVAGLADQTMLRPRLKSGESLSGKVVIAGRTVRCDIDSVPDVVPEHVAADHRLGYTKFLGVPLRVRDRTIGVLSFRARRPFTDVDQELAEAFAGQAAVALEHARLVQEATRQASRMEALADIGRLLAETLDPELLARQVVGSTRALFGAQTSMLLKLDEATGDLIGLAVSGDAGPLPDDRLVCPAGTGLVGLALRERALVTSADVLTDSRVTLTDSMRARIEQAGYRGGMAVPLVVRGRVIGTLALGTQPGRAFTADERSLAQAFATQAAVALDNASLYAEATRRRREAEVIADVARSLNSALDTDTILQQVTEYARDLCHADLAVIALRELGGETMILRNASGTRARRLHETLVEPGKGVGGMVIASGRPFRTDDYLADPRIRQDYAETVRAEGIVAELVVPLLSAGRVEGLLYVDNRTARPFTDRDEAVLTRLADHAAVAVTNARLYAAAAGRAARLRTLNRLNRLVSSSLDSAEVLTDIAGAAAEFMNSASVVFWLADEGTRTLRASAFSYAGARAYFADHTTAFGEGAPGWVAVHRMPLNVPDVFAPDSVVGHHDWWRANRLTSLLAVPVMQGERLLAVVSLAGREPFRLGPDDHELLESFVSQAAAAIRNAALYAETDRRRREAEVLAEVAGSINASLDLAAVLEGVSTGARELCGTDLARILLREPGGDTAVTRAGVGVRAPSTERLRIESGKGLGGTVLATGKPLRTADYATDPRFDKTYLDLVAAEGVVATMAVPIVMDGEVEGLLFVDHRTPRAFGDADEAVLTRLADHAAVAIRNARLYRETAEYAERLRALDEVNRLVSSSLNPDEVLENIAAAAARFFDAPWVSMWVVDETRGRVVRAFVMGDAALAASLPAELALGQGTVGWVAAHRSPMMWTGVGEEGRISGEDAEMLRAHELPFRLVYPIAVGERVLGVLAVNRAVPVPMTPETETLLRSLAAQAALALDHARLFSETARRLEQTRALLDVAELLSSTLDSSRLLERVTTRIAQVCRVDRCSIERWDGDRVITRMSQRARDGDGHGVAVAARTPYAPRQVPAHARAMETRRPVVIDDAAATDLLPREWIEQLAVKSSLVVPLVSQEKVIGVVTLDHCERPTRFADWQIDLAMAIAGHLALSLENMRLYAQVQDRLRETQALLAVAETLSQPGTPEDVMRRVARELGRATSADMVGAYFMNETKDALVAVAGHHVPDELLPTLRERRMRLATFPFVADALSMGRTVWSGDALRDPRMDPAWLDGLPPHAMLFVPTLAQGEAMGGLFLVWLSPSRPFPAAEIPLIEGVATQVGLSLENAELSRRTRIKLRETEALLSASRALASTLDLEAMLRHFMREALRTLGADTMAFWMLAGDGEWLEPFAAYHVPPEHLAQLRGLRVSTVQDAFYADAVQRRRPALSALGQDDERLPAHVRALPHRSHLFVPIVAKERVIGALAAVWWETARELSDSELALLEALGSQVGVTVENARLFSENRRQVDELSVLYDFSRAVTGELDAAALVDAVHAHLRRVMDVRNMVVLLREDDDAVAVALRTVDGVRNDSEPRRYARDGVGLMSVVLQTGRPLRTADYLGACARAGVEPVPYAVDFPNWLGAPMRAREQVLGAIAVRSAGRPYTEADERVLANVADLAALALRSSRLFDERARAYGELSAAQDQLVRTEKLRALGEMASGVAHDFNNLLASILGRAQLLLQRIEDPKLRRWLEVIERSALDGAQTVRRLQEFTRIRRDQPFVPVDLNQVVRDALEITQSRWREEPRSRGLPVELRTALGDIPRIAGDPVELREALTNLVLNAVDAMPRGGILGLGTRVVDGTVELSVSDTGIGMPESVRQRIFDPFFTTKGAQGTGLGLSITYGILTRHRARVVVESEPGQGTTFTLFFEPGPTRDPAERMVPAAPPPSGALRCLVVDDEESVGTVLGEVLEMGGHNVAVFTSGAEAVERFRAEPFDVVFTDLAMPGVSGWQVARAIKGIAPAVPVFLVTGFGVELSAEERQAHGVDLVLNKPLNVQSILDAVAFAATRRGQEAR